MTDEALAKAVAARPKVTMKHTRADLINQVVRDAEDQLHLLRKEAMREARGAAQKFCDALNAAALKKAEPIRLSLKKHGTLGDISLFGGYCYSIPHRRRDDSDSVASSHEPVVIRISDNSHYNSDLKFNVSFHLTKTLRALRDKADAAYMRVNELEKKRRVVDQRTEVRDRLVRQSLENSPEGKAALKAFAALREQVEETLDKNILEA